ncbi:NUDIX hydrolase [Nonomuraea sp. NPDC050536]|uniref:NUDIX hydrolase n=1 Tax=Nonomuraea sp. NPDC050536 TaxID=3364366 RepID=UPI0037CCB2E3
MSSDRPAARVVCVDPDGKVLLLRWHDRVSGETFWEPPGGGIQAGETPLEAARRELTEETGLPGSAVQDRHVAVPRDFVWLGVHYVKTEQFYLAEFDECELQVDLGSGAPEEVDSYRGAGWFYELPARVQPPELAEVIKELT